MGRLRRVGWLCTFGLLILACGGGGGDGPSVSPPPTSPPPPPPPAAIPTIDVVQVFPSLGFDRLVSLQQAPGDSTRWFAVEQGGVIQVFANDPGASATGVFLDISDRVLSGGERGLLGMAFHPDFPGTPEVFVSYTRDPDGASRVSRFRSTDGGLTLDDAPEEVLLAVPQDFANHNGGNILFGPDGYLHVGFGDGGSAGDPLDRAQDNTNLLGTMVRIDVRNSWFMGAPPERPS